MWQKILQSLPFFCLIIIIANSYSIVPDVKFDALESSGFRAYIPDTSGTTRFDLSASVNKPIENGNIGELHASTRTASNGYLVVYFQTKLNIGDTIQYWVVVHNTNSLVYKKAGLSWTVIELQKSYAPFNCQYGVTVVDGHTMRCAGQIIFEDEFNVLSVDQRKWTVEHRITTYTGPSFIFNSYQNSDTTRFVRNGILHLKPIPSQSQDDVRGVLDLRNGCTSKHDAECFYRQGGSFLLPPVKSARITSNSSFKYGKIEIKAKLPAGEWIYPVIQLEPRHEGNENATKIWIAYSRGNSRLVGNNPSDDLGSTLLFAGPVFEATEPIRSKKLVSKRVTRPYNEDFHIFTLEWLPDSMRFFLDGESYGSLTGYNDFTDWSSSLEKEFVLSLGVAVGGFNDFPDGYKSGYNSKPWVNWERNAVKNFFDARNVWLKSWNGDDTALKIDYVKVWSV